VPIPPDPWFNAHHSPFGAFATLTLGMPGSRGGLGLGLTKPADCPIYVGYEVEPNLFEALPFFDHDTRDESERYTSEQPGHERTTARVRQAARDSVMRELDSELDVWSFGDFRFEILSSPAQSSDPASMSTSAKRETFRPSVALRLTLDNRSSTVARRVFFGTSQHDPYSNFRRIDEGGLVGFGQGTLTGIATREGTMSVGMSFGLERCLDIPIPENQHFLLGPHAVLIGEVPAGEMGEFDIAVGFWQAGQITTGIPASYLYTTVFDDIEDVLQESLSSSAKRFLAARVALNARREAPLSETQKLLQDHAIRSYVGSSQMLVRPDGPPLWVMNEGEYRMMNTFDLTADHLWFEMQNLPWAVRDTLQLFVDRYSYEDGIRAPGSEEVLPGGISFTHDMGVGNQFSRPGYSSYELAGLDDCFSYMTMEQLVNWVCCAGVYAESGDLAWIRAHKSTLDKCLASMENRDHPDPAKRNGIMGFDAARCQGGAEITTYDSLDVSLGQSRNNVYLGIKSWAGYLLLEKLNREIFADEATADRAKLQADRAAATIISAVQQDGTIPAVLFEGVESVIIPLIEGLVFPMQTGLMPLVESRYPELLAALKKHFEVVISDGRCKFPSGGWKLSSTSVNSWCSKIFLCQHVARTLWGYDDPAADAVHWQWVSAGENGYWAFSDQILDGVAGGSRYYPRGVTNVLWG
jgi:xylan 1,4-beta-xylosidase